ncbi:hemerythrin domain-containing protein [Variovorax paradoxus]|uniref:bacteriohemerythrin n=1 Tax=Variovorax paradoxus TaxID=34073 RepID=UPI0021ACA3E3|nr:hemerythrin domain-containing protein [Variovorax paradoxus]UVH60526.1 hemerythrin domain-containing protein [Variovorax paradoxus]
MGSATSTSAAFAWTDDLRLGWAPMDAIHEEFVELVRSLLSALPEEISEKLQAIRTHTEQHFAEEERWMDESGFPARSCHAEEHAAVLASMAGVTRKVAAGHVEAARDLARALIDWFPSHAGYLDSALAQWLCKQHLGGQPVVLRRSIAAPSQLTPETLGIQAC